MSNLSPETLLDFVEGDFATAWNAVAGTPGPINRCNFMFGWQAMCLLELACRLCQSDPSVKAIAALTDALYERDRRYFAPLPGECWSPPPDGKDIEFQLPSKAKTQGVELIAAMFDLIRNGQAHQYQQITASLSDGAELSFSLTGAEEGLFLDRSLARGRPGGHLRRTTPAAGGSEIKVRTDVLFLDLRESIRAADLLGRGLSLKHLERPRGKSSKYKFSGEQLNKKLAKGGL